MSFDTWLEGRSDLGFGLVARQAREQPGTPVFKFRDATKGCRADRSSARLNRPQASKAIPDAVEYGSITSRSPGEVDHHEYLRRYKAKPSPKAVVLVRHPNKISGEVVVLSRYRPASFGGPMVDANM